MQEFCDGGALASALGNRLFHTPSGVPFLDSVLFVLIDVARGMVGAGTGLIAACCSLTAARAPAVCCCCLLDTWVPVCMVEGLMGGRPPAEQGMLCTAGPPVWPASQRAGVEKPSQAPAVGAPSCLLQAHIHAKHVIHGDLTPSNILLKSDSTKPWCVAALMQVHVYTARRDRGCSCRPAECGVLRLPWNPGTLGHSRRSQPHIAPPRKRPACRWGGPAPCARPAFILRV